MYDTGGKPIFFGGKLASDLTLPQLQRRWQGPGAGAGSVSGPAASAARRAAATQAGTPADARTADRFGLTPGERLRIWKQATLAATTASEHITASANSDPKAAADAAWAASDFLAAAGRVVEGRRGGPLTEAARSYDSAARELFGRVPPPSSAGSGLRVAGRLLLAAQVAKPSELKQVLALIAQLAALSDAVTRLRETQQRAGQARAARQAAEQLRAATARYRSQGWGDLDASSGSIPGRGASGSSTTAAAAASRGPRR